MNNQNQSVSPATIGLDNTTTKTTAKAAPAKARCGKVKAAQMISDSNGRFFTVVFDAAKGERKMTARIKVTKGIKGTRKAVDTKSLGLIKVYDMLKKSWRTVNLQTVKSLKINKTEYKVS